MPFLRDSCSLEKKAQIVAFDAVITGKSKHHREVEWKANLTRETLNTVQLIEC